MKQIINLLLSGRRLMFSENSENTIRVVSDNDCFYLKLETEEVLPTAVFARITRDGNFYYDALLDEKGMCAIPQSMLETGDIEVGFYSSGFATTVLRIKVQSSVIRRTGIEDTFSEPSLTDQLIALVNSIPVINGASINDKGELVLQMINSADYNAGRVMGPKGEKGDPYTLTEEDKNEIAVIAASVIDNELSELLGTGVEE